MTRNERRRGLTLCVCTDKNLEVLLYCLLLAVESGTRSKGGRWRNGRRLRMPAYGKASIRKRFLAMGCGLLS